MTNLTDQIFSFPHYYHLAFSWNLESELQFFKKIFSTDSAVKLLLPACGTGRYVYGLALQGFDVTGFDISEKMLAYAQINSKHKHTNYCLSDMVDMNGLPREKFTGALLLNNSFRYMLDADSCQKHLVYMSSYLADKAKFLIELGLNDTELHVNKSKKWGVYHGDSIAYAEWTMKELKLPHCIDKIKITISENGKVSSIEEEQKQLVWSFADFLKLIQSTNFEIITVYDTSFSEVTDEEILYNKAGKYYLLLQKRELM